MGMSPLTEFRGDTTLLIVPRGVDENHVVPRRIELSNESGMHQKSLFDDL